MFGDKNAILFDGNATQIGRLARVCPDTVSLGEFIFVTPGKSLCNPFHSAEVLAGALAAEDTLHGNSFRYRKSGPQKGDFFARPAVLREHIAAKKARARAMRLPGPEADKLNRQVIIEVLGLDASNHEDLPDKIMQKTSEIHFVEFTRQKDSQLELAYSEWTPVQRDGRWGGRILLLCPENLLLSKLFKSIHGRTLCLNGVNKTLAVWSPMVDSLAAKIFNETVPNS